MKLYELKTAPNPRRVRIFMAEKGLHDIETVQVDLSAGENLGEDFLNLNPLAQVPVLELDDGTRISESIAICRYLEALYPEPNLMGKEALEQAEIEMWQRRIEFNLFYPVLMAFRNIKGLFADRERICAEWGEISLERARKMFAWLDTHLAGQDYIAGSRFTVADITALCAVDFARVVALRHEQEGLKHLEAWHRRVSERPSATA
ncbi:MAG: glutathione S-transferase family protein [Pseudomonadota bacterium]